MWTPTTRRRHSRDHLRYPSDLTDGEWEIIAPFLPQPAGTGRPRAWPMREIMNAILYVLRAGCAWRLLPKDVPPRSTVYGWFLRFRRERLFEALNHHLVMLDRERVGARGQPTSRRDRQPERQNGRGRRSQVLDALPADIQDRDGAVPLLQASRRSFPFIELAFADSAYNARRVEDAACITIEAVKKIAGRVGFQVVPRRWVVERFFAWINRNRRLARDFEASVASATTFLYAASIMLLIRRLARSS